MTKQEFIQGYAERSGLTKHICEEGIDIPGAGRLVARPCACGEESCGGWAMLHDSPEILSIHEQLYSPEARARR